MICLAIYAAVAVEQTGAEWGYYVLGCLPAIVLAYDIWARRQEITKAARTQRRPRRIVAVRNENG